MNKSNEGYQILKARRSVRTYEPQQITEEELQALLAVATSAPNAHNLQRFHFSVVQDKALLDEMAEQIRQNMLKGSPEQVKKASEPGYSPLHHAPTVIFISGELGTDFHVQTDCGAAAGLITAAASELGLASCVTGSSLFMFKGEDGMQRRTRLGIPDGYNVVCAVAVGYLQGEYPAVPNKKADALVTYVR